MKRLPSAAVLIAGLLGCVDEPTRPTEPLEARAKKTTSPPAACPPAGEFSITDLGTLGGGSSVAFGINDRGEVVGVSENAAAEAHAFLWTAEGGMRDLGTSGSPLSIAFDINERREVVGFSEIPGVGSHAFLWTAEGGMQDLGTLRPEDKHKSSRAEGINDLGQVVGSSEIVTNEGGGDRAFLWTADGGMQDLGALPGATFSYATDINERGEVVGASQTAGGEGHAFLWTQADGFKDLGTLGGSSSAAQAINDLGHVVGGIDAHAFLWTAESGMKDLGKPPGSDLAFAFDINTLGQVVVLSVTSGLNQAFVWTQADGFQELVTLGGNYSQALAINERGQVAGSSSTAGGEAHAVVWQLTTSPTAALAALADNVAALARAGKLTRGEAHALGAKLDQVARLLERGKHKTAGNVLGAFVNQVEALIRSGRLARSDGQPLRDAASCIIARLREGVGE